MASNLSIQSYLDQVVAGQPRKPSPIKNALQAIQDLFTNGLTNADIRAGAGIEISKTELATFVQFGGWTPGYGGFSVNPSISYATYERVGKKVTLHYKSGGVGTSNATTFTITGLPVAAKRSQTFQLFNVTNGSGGIATGIGQTGAGSTTLTLFTDHSGAGWNGAAVSKDVNYFQVTYEVD